MKNESELPTLEMCQERLHVLDELSYRDMTDILEIPNEKAQLRITVKPNDSVEWWMKWQRGNHMKKNWFKQFTKGKDYYSWYVSETDIPVSDILIVEDIVTGEVVYFKEQEQN